MKNKSLSFGIKLGYGFGTLGECLAMNTFYIFFIFFLTEAAGVSASMAGTISAIAVFWGAFTDLIAGARSDSSTNPAGRRRPFIIRSAIPLGIIMFLMYTDFSIFTGMAQFAYFLIASLLFWLSLSFADIPYLSLGSEISDDYEERNTIRAIANILNYAGMILASSGTLMLVATLGGEDGVSSTTGWSIVGGLYGAIILISYIIAAGATKGKEPANPNNTEQAKTVEKVNYFRGFLDILKIKSFLYIIIYTVFGYGSVLLFTSIAIYYTSYTLGMSEGQYAMLMLIYSIMVMIISAVFAGIGTKIEKRTIVLVTTGLVGIVLIVMNFMTVTIPMMYFIMFIFALAISAYFVQIYSMVYDVCDVDEYRTGGGRDGLIVSMFYFVGKVIGGVAMFAVGWILTFANYDPSLPAQTAETLSGIQTGTMLIPGIGFIIGAVAIIKYPINHKNFTALRTAIESRATNKDYSEEGFKELLK